MPTLLLFFSGALAQFLVPGRASLFNDDDTNIHYHLYLLSVRIPFTLDGGVRTPFAFCLRNTTWHEAFKGWSESLRKSWKPSNIIAASLQLVYLVVQESFNLSPLTFYSG